MKGLLFSILIFINIALAADTSRFHASQVLWQSELENQAIIERQIVDSLRQYRRNLRQLNIDKTRFRQQVEETELILASLESFGYLDARIEPQGNRLTYLVRPGPAYRIGQIEFVNLEILNDAKDIVLVSSGDKAQASKVLDSTNLLQRQLEESSCLWQSDLEYRARKRPDSQLVDLTFVLLNSQQVRVGQLQLQGLDSVDPSWLNNRIRLQPGTCFNQSKLNREILSLYNTDLFSVIQQELELEDDRVNLSLTFTERRHRTIKSGLGWNTDLGTYGRLGFEHRNLWQQGEKLTSELLLARKQQRLNNELSLPDLQFINSEFSLSVDLEHNQTEFFDIVFLGLGARFTQNFSPRVRGRLGAGYRLVYDLQDEIDPFRNELRLPLEMTFDSRNNRFNPVRGQLQSIGIEPVFDIDALQPSLVNLHLFSSNFHSVRSVENAVFASRLRIDWVQPWLTDTLFADELLYLGGTQDLRGYPYQSILVQNIGGLSKTSFSSEWRHQLTDLWGYSLFWDASQLRRQPLIFSNDPWYHGVGLGMQFYTDFAPIRADLAFPLTEHPDGKDSRFEFYLHVGQAF